MIIEPNSNIRLIISSLELDNLNQLTFNSKQAQENYFKSLPYVEIDDSSYQRKDGYIRFPLPFDEAIKYTYCMYQNEGYSNKWFYAFVKDVEYLNDETSAMYLETDVYQTWCFDMLWKESFIEREMLSTADDIIGANTQPENVETGDYISTILQPSNTLFNDIAYCVATTEPLLGSYTIQNQRIPSGFYYNGFDNVNGVKDFIDYAAGLGKADSVNTVFVTPKNFFSNWGTATDITGNVSTSVVFEISQMIEVAHVNYLGNQYYPKNKKLLTYPYSFLQVSNHSGTIVNYKWENFNLLTEFSNDKYQFSLQMTLTPSCSGYARPINYNNILDNYDEGIAFGKFPIGSWNTDIYTNWLTQNGVNIPLSMISSGISTVAGAVTGNAIGVASGFLGVAQTLGSIYEHSLIPNQANGNINSGDVNFQFNHLSLEFKRMSIKNEYARVIDNYFSMYGYKTNLVKLPNLNNRSKWNFVKTINANITGDIPQKDIQKLKEIFNNGITLWHDPLYFLDYSQTNS